MATAIPQHKVVLCGEYGVGKTSIFRRYVDNCFIDVVNQPTLGLDNFGKSFKENGQEVKVSSYLVGLFTKYYEQDIFIEF